MLYDVDIEASACVLSSRYAMLCFVCLYSVCPSVSSLFILWTVLSEINDLISRNSENDIPM